MNGDLELRGRRARRITLAVAGAGLSVWSCSGGTSRPALAQQSYTSTHAVRLTQGDEPDDENDGNEDVNGPPVGALPKSIEYYKTNGVEFYDHFQGMPWHGHKRMRKCKGCAPGAMTKVRIQALSNQQKQPLTGFAPSQSNGVVVGRVRNVGDETDSVTEIPPTNGGKTDEYYYIITDKGDPKAARLWVAHLQFEGFWPFYRPKQAMEIKEAQYGFLKCHDVTYSGKKSDGDFLGCPGNKLVDPTDAIAWFSCDGGCCSAQWPPSVTGIIPGQGPRDSTRRGPPTR